MTKYNTIDQFGPVKKAINNNAVLVSTRKKPSIAEKMANNIKWLIKFSENSIGIYNRESTHKELEIFEWEIAVLDIGVVRKYFGMAAGPFFTTSIIPRIEVIQTNGNSIVLLSENFEIIKEAFEWAESNRIRVRDEFGLNKILEASDSISEYVKKYGEDLFKEQLDEKYNNIYSNHADNRV
jgi:hypothetical protein